MVFVRSVSALCDALHQADADIAREYVRQRDFLERTLSALKSR